MELACARPASVGAYGRFVSEMGVAGGPVSGRRAYRIKSCGRERMAAADSGVTALHVCFDDEDTGGLPAGQRQARCLRDFPGHVASRVDAILPERPCGRVLGAASSDRNVRNRQCDCSAVCRLPATRCLDVAGYGVTTFGRGTI